MFLKEKAKTCNIVRFINYSQRLRSSVDFSAMMTETGSRTLKTQIFFSVKVLLQAVIFVLCFETV